MGGLFSGCNSLTNLDLSNFETSNVTNFTGMFRDCNNLVNLDLSNFNTLKVTSLNSMFYGCSSLVSVDLSSFNTSNVTNTTCMFYKCGNLKTIYASNNFITTKITKYNDSGLMFGECINLIGGNGTVFNTRYTYKDYARIDREGQPGYFTDIIQKPIESN